MQAFNPVQDWFSKFELAKNDQKKLLNPESIHLTNGTEDSVDSMKNNPTNIGGGQGERRRQT